MDRKFARLSQVWFTQTENNYLNICESKTVFFFFLRTGLYIVYLLEMYRFALYSQSSDYAMAVYSLSVVKLHVSERLCLSSIVHFYESYEVL